LNNGDPQKGNHEEVEAAGDTRPKTPNPWSDIKIYGEVSFTHKVIPQVPARRSPSIIVSGHVDHGIVVSSHPMAEFQNATEQRKRRFYSLLLLVEAKFDGSVNSAITQLIVYLASLHQSRLQRKRKNASVYGVASDGYAFTFVKISYDGTVMMSRQFNILEGEMKKVLAGLRHILDITASRSPNSRPERNDGDKDDESDPHLTWMTISL